MNNSTRLLTFLTLSFSALALLSKNGIAMPFSITDIGVLSGDVGSRAYDINNNGTIVGFSYNNNAISMGTTRAFSWSSSLGIQKVSGSSDTNSIANAVNDKGQIVGTSNGQAFLWDEATGLRNLGGLWPGAAGEAFDVNENGQTVGQSYVPGGTLHAFLWQNGSAQDLGTLGGYSYAKGISDGGQIVGYSKIADGPGFDRTHAFIWEESTGMQDLGPYGGSVSFANAINDHDVSVGVSNKGGLYQSFLFDDTGSIVGNIGTLGGATWASSLNNANQVVGRSYKLGVDYAFLWEQGIGIRNLNDLIPTDSNWVLNYATSINDKGQIVGYGVHNGVARGFLLSPVPDPEPPPSVPEPSTLALLFSGMLIVMTFSAFRSPIVTPKVF